MENERKRKSERKRNRRRKSARKRKMTMTSGGRKGMSARRVDKQEKYV